MPLAPVGALSPALPVPGEVPPQAERHTLDDGKGGWITPVRHLLMWSQFGIGDADLASPQRVTGQQIREEMMPILKPGDTILCGTEGRVTHVAMYVGEGRIVHAMGTELTQRRPLQRVGDFFRRLWERPAEALGLRTRRMGVIEEGVDGFFERFYRETWVVMRPLQRTTESPDYEAATERVRGLVGKRFDPDFVRDNDRYYCSEIVREYYWTALGKAAPRVGARSVDKAMILHRKAVIDPEDFLLSPDLIPVGWNREANQAVAARYALR